MHPHVSGINMISTKISKRAINTASLGDSQLNHQQEVEKLMWLVMLQMNPLKLVILQMARGEHVKLGLPFSTSRP